MTKEMGLDMFLYKVKREEVAYWRKANAIHAWFEEKNSGLENCQEYYVSKEDLIELRDLCEKVVNNSILVDGFVKNGERLNGKGEWVPIMEPGKIIKNPSLAQELLPTQSGFFFGSTDYDDRYIEDLKSTIEQLDKVIDETDWDNESICYTAWW